MFTSNRNEITSLYGVDADGDGVEDDDIANAWFIGEPVLVEFGLESDGIWQEGDDIPSPFEPGDAKFKDINGNGEFEGDNDRTVVGQREPKFIWGLGNTLNYKNFSFSFFVTGQHGFIREFRQLDPSLGGSNFPGRAVNMLDEGDGWWTPENRSNTRPRLNYNNALGQQFYADRDFVRLQDVSLSYTFNDAVLDKLKLSNLKVFLSGRNLVTLTDWPGWDPENGDNNFNAFPAARTYMIGRFIGAVSMGSLNNKVKKYLTMVAFSLLSFAFIYLITSIKNDGNAFYFEALSLKDVALFLVFLTLNFLAFLVGQGKPARLLSVFAAAIIVLLIAMEAKSR